MSSQIFFALLNPAIAIGFAAIFGLMWQRWPARAYLAPMTAAFVCAAGFFLVQEFLMRWHDEAGRMLANLLLITSVTLACCGGLLRINVRPPVALFVAIGAVGAMPFAWFLYIYPDVVARIAIISAIMAALSLVGLAMVLSHGPRTMVERAIALCAALGFLVSVTRPLLVLAGWLDVNQAGSFHDSMYWATVQAFSPILILGIALVMVMAIVVDIVDQLKSVAQTDYLTGLLNRRGFEVAAAESLAVSKLGHHPALLLADIDNFKRINDSHGHKVGDNAIAMVARMLSSHGAADYVARIGGEEFALFYAHATRSELSERVATIQASLASARTPGLPADHVVTVSIGLHPTMGSESLTDMMGRADKALYRAKQDGKNRAVWTPLTRPAMVARSARA
ncbi:MAG: hypothetical protein ABS75_17865 [Pelagibacterium sp. SCN 63-23]|nr:MAG: hypothetical protein ABS75_17865 [Pelagibacterium sp. SCN 63-23]